MNRLWLGHVPLDPINLADAIDAIHGLVRRGEGGTVFTPNVDHVVRAEDDLRFRAAYASVSLSLIDGMPVLWACQLLGRPAPGKVSGSDLVRPLSARAAAAGLRLYLLGGDPGVADRAAALLTREHPGLLVVGVDSPTIEIAAPPESRRDVLERIRRVGPDLVLVAFGSPKGELWAAEACEALRPSVLVSVGAALDFLAGIQRRAPPWMSRLGVEWLHRLAHDPKRLWRRYLLRGPRFVPLLLRCLWQAHSTGTRA